MRLLEVADSIEEVKMVCSECTKKSTVNARYYLREDGTKQIVYDAEQIAIGGEDMYYALCFSCWDKMRQPETTPSPQRPIKENSAPEYPHLPRHSEEKLERLHDTFPDIMEKYPRAYVDWTSEEESIMRDLFESGLSVSQISDKLERNSGGVRSRLRKLEIEFPE
jgi:hypothetical protein